MRARAAGSVSEGIRYLGRASPTRKKKMRAGTHARLPGYANAVTSCMVMGQGNDPADSRMPLREPLGYGR